MSDSLRPHELQHPVFPVHHQLPEFTQIHVHRVGDAIQPSHLLSSPSPPSFNLSQHQCISNESVLHIRRPKYWSFSFSISPSNEYQDWFPLGLTGWISLLSKELSRIFSNTTVWRHQFFGSLSSLRSSSQLYSNKIKRKMRSYWISCCCFSRVWLFVTLGL